MKKLYKNFPKKTFINQSIGLCFTGDLIIVLYIYLFIIKMLSWEKISEGPLKKAMLISQVNIDDIPEHILKESMAVMINTIYTVVIFYLIVHILIYLVFYFQKKIALNYVKIMSWGMLITFVLIFISGLTSLNLMQMAMGLMVFPYYYVAKGISHHFPLNSSKTISTKNPE